MTTAATTTPMISPVLREAAGVMAACFARPFTLTVTSEGSDGAMIGISTRRVSPGGTTTVCCATMLPPTSISRSKLDSPETQMSDGDGYRNLVPGAGAGVAEFHAADDRNLGDDSLFRFWGRGWFRN